MCMSIVLKLRVGKELGKSIHIFPSMYAYVSFLELKVLCEKYPFYLSRRFLLRGIVLLLYLIYTDFMES